MANENKKITLDETAFIIGSGPSLNKIDMSLIKDLDTFGMNRQYIAFEDWGFEPKYYCIIDRRLVKEIFETDVVQKLANNPKCTIEKFFVSHNTINYENENCENEKIVDIPAYTQFFHGPEVINQLRMDKVTKLHSSPVLEDKPSINPDTYGNCGMFATNLAYMLGYKRAVLLGIDARYGRRKESIESGQDLEHFHPKYFDPKTFIEGKTHGPSEADGGLDEWKKFLIWMSETTEKNGFDFEIICSSPDSNLQNLDKFIKCVPLEEILNGKV